MFTDMVGYTALGQRNESLALALVEEQRKLIRPILARHNGREIKTIGDAFLVEFPNAVDSVRCAYDIQRAARELNFSLELEKRIHLRVGVHMGEVVEDHGDILGDAVNVASRIEALAEDGGVCLTRSIYELVRDKVDLELSALGSKVLKNVSEPMEVFSIVTPWQDDRVRPRVKYDTRRIAILPFSNISPNPDDAYIADGMTEELISTMSKISGLKVLARTSVMRYKSGERNVEDIARELKAGTCIEGSVRKAGDKVRITVQVIDSTTSVHLWSESYDRQMKDVFAVQADISQTVADALKVRLLKDEKARIQAEPTKNTEAHALFLKGVYYNMNNDADEASLRNSVKCLEKAIGLDPSYASAYAWLADSYGALLANGFLPFGVAYMSAQKAVTKALELDPTLAEAHRSLSLLKFLVRDVSGSLAETERAVALGPNDAWSHAYHAIVLANLGRIDEAEVEGRVALDLAPFDRPLNRTMAIFLYRQRKYIEAIDLLKRLQEVDPEMLPSLYHQLGRSYLQLSEYDKAIEEFQKALDPSKGDADPQLSYLAVVYAKSGRRKEAERILQSFKRISQTQYVPAFAIAKIHLALNEVGDAIDVLEKAYEENDYVTLDELKFEPMYDELRSNPRFIALLEKLTVCALVL